MPAQEHSIRVIAGDIGGTKTLIQLATFASGEPSPRGEILYEQRYESGAYPDLEGILRTFMAEAGGLAAGELRAACLGVAGPVRDEAGHQSARLTNLPWTVDSDRLAAVLGTRVRLINDFQAVGYGIDAMTAADLVPLQTATVQPRAPRLVLGAGTGLGVGLLFWDGSHYESYPTEGGHIHFAPVDEPQEALLRFLRAEYGRVSCERLVSGPGLVAIYRFLAASAPGEAAPHLGAPDPAAALSRAALEGTDTLAQRALTLFTGIYGAVAGDLALTCLARGGVYIAGGIAPKILPALEAGGFMAAFHDKGRMRPLVEQMPVHIIINPRVGLLGTALAATRM